MPEDAMICMSCYRVFAADGPAYETTCPTCGSSRVELVGDDEEEEE